MIQFLITFDDGPNVHDDGGALTDKRYVYTKDLGWNFIEDFLANEGPSGDALDLAGQLDRSATHCRYHCATKLKTAAEIKALAEEFPYFAEIDGQLYLTKERPFDDDDDDDDDDDEEEEEEEDDTAEFTFVQ